MDTPGDVKARRAAKFAETHERLKGTPGPRGTKPRVPHAGGVVISNKQEAIAKFLARSTNGATPGKTRRQVDPAALKLAMTPSSKRKGLKLHRDR